MSVHVYLCMYNILINEFILSFIELEILLKLCTFVLTYVYVGRDYIEKVFNANF